MTDCNLFNPDLLDQQTLQRLSWLDYRKYLILQASLNASGGAPVYVLASGIPTARMANIRGSLFGELDFSTNARTFIEVSDHFCSNVPDV